MNVERAVDFVTRLKKINEDRRFVEAKMTMALRRRRLCPSWGRPMELAMLEIEFPVVSFQRGLATRLGFKDFNVTYATKDI